MSKKFTIENIDERMIYVYIMIKTIIYLKTVCINSKINYILLILSFFHYQLFLFYFQIFSIRKMFNFRTTLRSKIKKKINIIYFISYTF